MPNFHLSQYQITCHYKTDNVPDVVISVVFHSHLFVHLDFNCSAKTTAIILRIAPQNYCSFVQLFYELFPIFLCCIGITGSPQCLLHRFTGGNIYGNIRTDLPAYLCIQIVQRFCFNFVQTQNHCDFVQKLCAGIRPDTSFQLRKIGTRNSKRFCKLLTFHRMLLSLFGNELTEG